MAFTGPALHFPASAAGGCGEGFARVAYLPKAVVASPTQRWNEGR
jgi:hypothetical protein